jgi:hypothetical protein
MLLIRFSLAILDTFGLDDESSPSSRMPDCRYDEVLFVDGATVAKDRVRKIRDRKAIGSNYSFGPHLPLSFLLLFFLLTEIERGRVRKIAAKRRYEYEAFTRWSVPYYSAVFSFAFLFVDGRKR